MPTRAPLSFFQTVSLLLSCARKRAKARSARQSELMSWKKSGHQGTKGGSNPLGCLGTLGAIILGSFAHWAFATVIVVLMQKGAMVEEEGEGRIALPRQEHEQLQRARTDPGEFAVKNAITEAAYRIHRQQKGSFDQHFDRLNAHYEARGMAGFVVADARGALPDSNDRWPRLTLSMLSLGVLLWLLMLVCQGEGLELDIQRRRHPVWEWLLSHPIRPAAMLIAEGFAPLACNPMFYTAPIFWITLLSKLLPDGGAFFPGLAIGLLTATGASLLNKTIESVALLRIGARNRGALLGIMSWAGFAAMVLPLLFFGSDSLQISAIRFAEPALAHFPQAPGAALAGIWQEEEPRAGLALISGIVLAFGMGCAALGLAAFAAARGLRAEESGADFAPARGFADGLLGRRDPVFRKELLWFARDRGAVIQAILIPLTIGAFQAVNLRGLTAEALSHWPAFCGLAIICGTYFLFVLGPRSLASEGGALWIPLTWPRGLEDLLRAKARLWETLANVIAGGLFLVALAMFPGQALQIILIAAGWLLFARSMALRSVTLVTVVSDSGEAKPPPAGSRYAAKLGILAFAFGVISQNWHMALAGVVFSQLVAAAAWQNLRARLPFLFDPWSEKLPPAPTLLHAMLGVAILVEVVAIVTSIAYGFGGADSLAWAQALSYGIVGFVLWLVMQQFLAGRGVTNRAIWEWPQKRAGAGAAGDTVTAAALGAGLGVALALFALAYLAILSLFPATSEIFEVQNEIHTGSSKVGVFLLAVFFAPIAEEYLFRGLLYRALDREWGGWRAMLGSAAYFAIYHPPLSWLPVFLLGFGNAYLFRRTGSLYPCVISHAVYNALVVGFQ